MVTYHADVVAVEEDLVEPGVVARVIAVEQTKGQYAKL